MIEGEKYELLVRSLLRTKIASDGGAIPKVHHRARYEGASGQSYEIDLSFTTTLAGANILVLLECKCYSTPVGQEIVTDFAYKVRDVGAHKGIIVSTASFTTGAQKIAAREGIALVTAKKAWTMVVYHMHGHPAPYVVYAPGRSSFSYPKGSATRYDGPPPYQYVYTEIGESLRSDYISGPEICFEPALAGFDGGPFGLFQAAGVFLIENDLPFGQLLKMHRYF